MIYLHNSGTTEGKALVEAIFEWDVSTWSKALEVWLPQMRERALHTETPRALDIGARHGGLTLLAALEGFTVDSTDITQPGEEARALHLRYGVSKQVRYAAIDVTHAHLLEKETYDLVMFKSILGGIGHSGRDDLQLAALQNMSDALKPGGILCFAENLKGTWMHETLRKRFTAWGKAWNYPDLDRLVGMLRTAKLDPTLYTTGVLATFGRTESQRHWLGKLDRHLLNVLTPKRSRYVAFGFAVKA